MGNAFTCAYLEEETDARLLPIYGVDEVSLAGLFCCPRTKGLAYPLHVLRCNGFTSELQARLGLIAGALAQLYGAQAC